MQSVRRSLGSVHALLPLSALLVGGLAGCDGCAGGLGDTVPQIRANPETVVFGSVAVGSFQEQFVEVHNDGRGFLNILSIDLVEGPADAYTTTRLFTTNCSGDARTGTPEALMMIEPMGCARFVVRFGPSVDGTANGKLRISSNAQNAPELEVPLVAGGVKPDLKICVLTADGVVDEAACSDLSATPAVVPTLAFGAVAMGQEVKRIVRLFNNGSGELSVNEAYIQTDYADDLTIEGGGTFSATVAAGAHADVTIVFTPQGDDDPTGKLMLPTNDLKSGIIEVPITGDGRGPKLCVEPAEGLDFGSLAVGGERTLTITFSNCGPVNFTMKKLEFVEADSSFLDYTVPAGRLTSPSQTEIVLNAGDRWEVPVTFKPQRPNLTHAAFFSIETTYQRGTVPVTGNSTPGSCSAADTPVARITATPGLTVEPLDTVALSGAGSTAPRGGSLTYQWTLKSQPVNGTVALSPGSSVNKQLFAELAGDYVVELVVRDQYLCQSVATTATIRAQPQGSLHIQLTWPQAFGDVDLHLVAPNGRFYDRSGDCHWANCKSFGNPPRATLKWGGGSNRLSDDGVAANDPRLDVDALWGNGPENINIDTPFDGTYKIVASYFCDSSGSFRPPNPAVTARTKVYVNGAAGLDVTKTLTQSDVWEIASVVVNGGQITVTPLGSVRKATATELTCD